jgi:iron complex transport system ATP-binding protein
MSTLRAESLRVALGGRTILNNIDLSLRAGEVTAILGPNGAGKSTLLACLAGLRKPDAGVVRLDEQPFLKLPARERGRRMAFLEQTPEIAWAVDCRTLVGLGRIPFAGSSGLSGEDAFAVERAMARTGVTEFADRIVNTLSGGERARVLLARALAGEPQWLLADEPLTGLDPGHQFDACDLFTEAARSGVGVVLTLHDLSLASRVAQRLIVLHDGVIAADGSPQEALSAELLARAYGVEAKVSPQGEGGAAGLNVELLGRLRG